MKYLFKTLCMKKKRLNLFLLSLILILLNCALDQNPTKDEDSSINYESEFNSTATVIDAANQHFYNYMLTDPTLDAQTKVVNWLLSNDNIESAGLALDEYTIWMNFDNDINAVIVTQIRGEAVPDDYATQYELNKTSSPNLIPLETRSQPNNNLFNQYASVGCSAWIFCPFQWETLTDPLKVTETEDLLEYYEVPGMGVNMATVFYNEQASIAALGAALISYTGPAVIFEVNTHGGKSNRNGLEFVYLLSGEEMTLSKMAGRYSELTSGLLTWGSVGGKNFLAITPSFVEMYSGKPDPAYAGWLARYVHINACFSYHSSMHNAFINNGAVTYSGFTDAVGWGYGAQATKDFFENLVATMDIDQAWDNVFPKTDPDNSKCDFELTGNVMTTHYFYRVFLTFDGTSMETPSYQWLPVYNSNDGSGGVYWSSATVDSTNKEVITGDIIIKINGTTTRTYNAITEDDVEIHFDDATTRWTCSKVEANAGKPCTGGIEITEFNNVHGGRIAGSFSAVLVDSHQTDGPYTTKNISGSFTVVRNAFF